MDDYLCKWALVILVLPLVGFLVQTFAGSRLPRQGDWVPTLCMFIPLAIASWMMVLLLSSPGGIEPQVWKPELGMSWLAWGPAEGTGGFRIDFGILVDNLTIIMLFVVTLVSFLVHLYSWGYMHGEVRYNYFFAYLGLFSFSMLGLCITSNLLFLFIFWELVGLCSYFLIGFYFEKKSAQNAAIKAFMTTRIGDLGFFAGILIIASVAGSLDFREIFESVRQGDEGPWTPGLLAAAGLCLFAGAAGKSGQFPLHVWLPDAMEGPTPVSALIHAATMVAAGVYLVGRMFPFLAGAPYFQGDFYQSDVLMVVALVGGFTAFFAATIAFVQTDIKKVLAYSTVSQLGYMMLAIGAGSIAMGFFHLFTHAFFKALLFLGAGSVIHAVHSNELDDMGGLRRKLPITWATFGIATLAIAGLPLLSGFYSKEGILGNAYAFAEHRGGALAQLPFIFGIVTAGMTAFYMFRLFFRTFHGEPQNHHAFEHAHESPWTMTVPLCVLAALTVVAGGIGGVFFNHSHEWFEARVSSAALVPLEAAGAEAPFQTVAGLVHDHHGLVMWLSIGMFAAGVGLAALFFLPQGPFYRRELVRRGTPLWPVFLLLKNLWFIDRFYYWLVMRVIHAGHYACGLFDKRFIDGAVNAWGSLCRFVTAVVGTVDYWGVDGSVRGLGEGTLRGGRWMRRLQTGRLQEYVYASIILFGGVVLISVLVIVLSYKNYS
jgi:NADH-quinone oxidoreductase subunit L